ncbi:tryptophan--tRNA ligase [Pseudomonas sp. NPDC090592]|uniref:tryptophan--tRNA ligase n=1 Tax=Pseudomonas sp. NPDC090592 TaxID=3364480 RepID=UPI00383B953B
MNSRILTGITTTGTPHLGNYAGALQPAIAASHDPQAEAFFFLADLHALIKCEDPRRIQRSRLEITATWLACGLDPCKTVFYRQSDIPEIPQLNWLLSCVTAKGLLNRAHAYKAVVSRNGEEGADPDAGVSMGLYSYPVLMAADILLFNAHVVPVGRDQVQHVEMARDIAQRFNHVFGNGQEPFVLPQARIREDVQLLPGLDGRKMSKSYDNTIALFLGSRELKDAVNRIVTDSKAPGEAKDPDQAHLFSLYQAFASAEDSRQLHGDLLAGLGWGEAKNRLYLLLEQTLGDKRERYHALMARPDELEDIVLAGAIKARKVATPVLESLREAVGLRTFTGISSAKVDSRSSARRERGSRLVTFKDENGEFRFRLLDANGATVLLSRGFADGITAGTFGQRLLEIRYPDLRTYGQMVSLWLDGEALAHSDVVHDTVAEEARFRAALDDLS